MVNSGFSWEKLDEGVWLATSNIPGPMVGILGGVHGDEQVGAELVRRLATTPLSLKRGSVILMLGNPAAVSVGKHYIDYNLNRSFLEEEDIDPLLLPSSAYEYHRSRVLLSYMRECRALLDLHQHYGPEVPPFIVCERDTLALAQGIGAPVISFGFSNIEPGGSDAFMHFMSRQGLCYELGANTFDEQTENIALGHNVVHRFLALQGLTDEKLGPLYKKPLLVEARTIVKRTEVDYWINPHLNTFDRLLPGELIATNGAEEIHAGKDQIIIFPDPEARIDDEAFIFGNIVSKVTSSQPHFKTRLNKLRLRH